MYTLHFSSHVKNGLKEINFEDLSSLSEFLTEDRIKSNDVWVLCTEAKDGKEHFFIFEDKSHLRKYFLFLTEIEKETNEFWLLGHEDYEDATKYILDAKDGTPYRYPKHQR